jgi:formyltetrahydrofolate deformylase
MTRSAVLLLACPDQPGIVSRISSHIFEGGGNIIRAEQSESVAGRRFFLRVHFDHSGHEMDLPGLRRRFEGIGAGLEADWSLRDPGHPERVAILVSKQPHCLLDLLARWRTGDIQGEIVAVISNHDVNRDIADGFRIPFHHLPVGPGGKAEQERGLRVLLRSLEVDLVVLARYMQILSDSLVGEWRDKVINIHHSFLPAFPGAKPYHQAMDRGVKLIGATAHYATAELDEGPIITQGVTVTSHRDGVADFVRRGREVESRVLAAAVQAHLEHRVIVDGRRTIVFE